LHVGGFKIATIAALIDPTAVNDFRYFDSERGKELQLIPLKEIDVPKIWLCVNRIHRAEDFGRLPVSQCLEFPQSPSFTLANFLRVFTQGSKEGLNRFAALWARSDPYFTLFDNALWYQQKMLRLIQKGHVVPNPAVDKAFQDMLLGNKCFFFSQNGEFGLCPKGTRCGDVVVALHGSNVPFILRRRSFPSGTSAAEQLRQGQKYELVGACYLEGAMEGDKMDSPHWHDPLHSEPLDFDLCLDPTGGSHRRGVYRTEFFHIE